ncbi:PAS domain S-box-containing protein [Christiangramia gaetbulicola]|uniref:histidine kinase n=1 Tax=Christiangramia gaetbulicola TaxID=703340 RepID=A0A2T6AFR2_9FLAO|nr:PAS domain S-box protein [Christiangramia gaetbulicola]PTX42642.1 PAS domain S-box-containing protein [Christiangramia gaetbulicola]
MNQDSSPNLQEAVITYSYTSGVLSYSKQPDHLLSDYLTDEFQIGKKLSALFEPDLSSKIERCLSLCKKGKFQSLSHTNKLSNLQLYFFPILETNGCIDKVSIVIEKEDLNAKPDLLSTSVHFQNKEGYNEQVYSNLFYNNPDAVFSFDLDGNFVNANKSSAELAETSISELLNMHFLPFIPEEDHSIVLDHFEKAKQGFNQNYQTTFQSLKGTFKYLEINLFPIHHKYQIIGVYGIAKDITTQKLEEKKVLEERQMLRAIIDNIPDYIFVKDREHKSILANRKFYEQILGKTSDESSLGYTPRDYFDREKGEHIIADNEWVMNTGQSVINRPDTVHNIQGKQEKVLLTKVPLKNQKEEIIGLVGVARDITETYLHNKKQELVFKVIKAFGDKPTLHEAMVKVLEIFCTELGYDYAEAFQVSVNNEKIVRTAFWPLEKDLSESVTTYEKGERLPGKVWQSGKVKILRQNDENQLLKDMLLSEGKVLKSAVGFPIIFQDRLISIFCLGSIEDSKKIEIELLEDITLQIASAIERKRSQEQLNDFFSYSPNLIAVIGMDGFVKKINPSFEEKFGYSECEILTKPFTEFIHPDDLAKTFEAIEKVYIEGTDFEIRCKRKDGEYLWISWRFSRFFEKENIVFIYGTDITPLKRAHEELSENITELTLVQEKLEESEMKYRSLFDASPLPMWVLDRVNLRFLKVNKAAIELYGYTEEEFSEMTVKDLWVPGQDEIINPIISENQNEFFQVKLSHFKKNGDLIHVNINSNPVIFDGIEARVSLIKNVTDRIKAEEKLFQSEQRFKALVQEGSDLISIVDENLNYFYNSPASNSVFGLGPSQLHNKNFRDYIHEEDLIILEDHLSKLESQKRVQLPSYRVKGAENNWRWMETIMTDLKDEPAIGGIVMNSRDITEFVEQEKELLESLTRYNIVSKATSDIITDYDIQKDEISVSEATFKIFGYEKGNGKYSSKWWNSKIHPEDHDYVRAGAKEMKENGVKNLTIEYRFQCADGSYKYILDRSYLMVDEKGNPIRIIGSMQDITERKQHLIAIENHNKRLKEIAWTQSHTVRAPLAKLMGLVDLLLNYKNDLENIDEILEIILTSANELDSIIRKIATQTE